MDGSNVQAIRDTATEGTIAYRISIANELAYLRRFARGLAGDATLADDLVHDCVVKALENMDKFEPGTNLRAWLSTILRNCFISHIRRNKRRLDVAEGPRWACGGVVGPNQESSLELRRLQREVTALPADQRVVLILVVLEGMSYEQTAETLGVPVGTIRSRLSRARHALRAAMDGGEVDARPEYRLPNAGNGVAARAA